MGGAFGVPGNLIHGSETQEPAESIQPPKSIFSQLWSLFGSHSGSSTAPSSGSTHSTPQFPDSVTNKLNRKAEWNIYIDPEAAEEVFSNKAFPQLLVGLDVTNKVPVTIADVEEFEIHQRMLHNIGKTIWTLLKENMEYIEAGEFFAWDQLAAMTLVDDSIVKSREAVVNVIPSTSPDEDSVGQTIAKWAEGSNVRVAIEADAKRFHDMFLKAFINENAFR
jgi:inosine-uridine nucleoside N-ribohydrolase